MQRIVRVLAAARAVDGIWNLLGAVGAPAALWDMGMRAEDLDEAADLATRETYHRPAPSPAPGCAICW